MQNPDVSIRRDPGGPGVPSGDSRQEDPSQERRLPDGQGTSGQEPADHHRTQGNVITVYRYPN